MAETQQPRLTYRGNCHCGDFVYEIEVPEIMSVGECNCSICHKKGYLWVFLEEENFKVVKGDIGQLTGYRFGRKRAEHRFCPTCGTGIMKKALVDEFPPGMELGVNVRSIQGISTWDLERKALDGRSRGSAYDPPAHKGGFPEAGIETGKLYTGSCHCGKATVAVKCNPIDETFDESPVIICNCSVCERGGYVWIYPDNEQVVLSGDDADIAEYLFGHRVVGKTFCQTCGVHLTNRFNADILKVNPNIAQGQQERQPPDADKKKWRFRASKKHPVNLRILEGVDLTKLKFRRIESANIPPLYVNP
ncbi:glutathione-dependent formaldehyde-activating enzyme [Fusarium oxysporum]|uniref:CENP-V/GFA domain-containing protein n=1 Tax=Fusarium oxysporum TaxID=5507 RepID=A0A420M769_FUSOX|nr:glutathione-dependent formaldehyde-activating enzyme [Fusarium oxysporum]KAH7204952.1 glutathione-dependent formaldehyde-activating enzyme [Fusarium oxysporum]RKK53832.1 hypothetical protein BFJ69_g17801 [Fusarium oxysporum]